MSGFVLTWGMPVYENLIFVYDKGLAFRDTDNETILLEWKNIKHIYNLGRYNNLMVIDKKDQPFGGRVLPDNHFSNASEKIKCIWETWRRKIPDAEQIKRFRYPDISSEKNEATISSILFGGPLFRFTFLLFLLLSIIDISILYIAIFVLLCHLFTAIPNLINLQKPKAIEVYFSQDIFNVVYDDKSVKNLYINNISKYNLDDPHKVGTIIFRNGTKLQNLDRVSYWPLLQEQLLSKLESSEKNVGKSM